MNSFRCLVSKEFHSRPPAGAPDKLQSKAIKNTNYRNKLHLKIAYTSSTRTRRGGSCLKDIYKTFGIYRTCMRHAPAKPVRACTLRNWCLVSHVTFEAPRHTSHLTVHTSHSTLHTSHCTLPTSHCTLPTAHSTLHTSHFTVHTSHFTVHSSHFTLHTSHFTLHTSHSTLHASRPTLHSSHFISSELFSPYPSSSLLISSLLICHLSFHESLPSTTTY